MPLSGYEPTGKSLSSSPAEPGLHVLEVDEVVVVVVALDVLLDVLLVLLLVLVLVRRTRRERARRRAPGA